MHKPGLGQDIETHIILRDLEIQKDYLIPASVN